VQGHPEGDELLAPDADLRAIFEDDEESVAVARSFLKVLELRNPGQLTYILLLLSSILQHDPRRGLVFLALSDLDILSSFSRVWLRDDVSSFCRGKAAICAAQILRWSSVNEEGHRSLCSFILRSFSESKSDQLLSPLLALKGVICSDVFAASFFAEGGIDRLSHILFENDSHRQVVYLTVYNMWALTIRRDKNAVYQFKKALLNGPLIDKLVNFVKSKLSTKVTRVTLALFEKMVHFENFNEMVVLFGLCPVLEAMESEESKMDDPELKASVSSLLDSLEKSVKILSSFERYEQEMRAEKLMWGPCHNESFWKKYSGKLEEDNFKLIRQLIGLLDSEDSRTVAVACYDIGEWARFYQDAKSVITKLNGKHKMMTLIDHYDAEVRGHALNSVQKLLVKNWKLDTTVAV